VAPCIFLRRLKKSPVSQGFPLCRCQCQATLSTQRNGSVGVTAANCKFFRSENFEKVISCVNRGLPYDFPFPVDVVPKNETVEVVAAGKKDAAFGLFCHSMRKTNVFFGL